MDDLIMLQVTQDVAGQLQMELSQLDENKPRHSLALDGELHVFGLYVVGCVQSGPGPDGHPEWLAGFRRVR